MRKVKSFSNKIKNQDLDVFDILTHYVDILDSLRENASARNDEQAVANLLELYLDANDRYMTVILSADQEEENQYDRTETRKEPYGFFHHNKSPVESDSAPDSESGRL